MRGSKSRGQFELFVTGNLIDLVPTDHVLFQVDQVLDLNWLRAEVEGFIAQTMVGPALTLRL